MEGIATAALIACRRVVGNTRMTTARAGVLLVAVAAVAATTILSLHVALLLSPALLLLVLLSGGLFPGEQVIERLRARYEKRRARPEARPASPTARVFVRRTGRLIAFALAVRPPPAQAAHLLS